jgi:dissimilatory sulfite reductase related protein
MPQIDTQLTSAKSIPPLFDAEGFLIDHQSWNEQMASDLARQAGVGRLSDGHWRVLKHIRANYLKLGALPNMRLVCRATGVPREEIHTLFGSCLNIWRIAGLPDPGEEAKSYLG